MHLLCYFNQFLLHLTIAFSRNTAKVSNKFFLVELKKLWRNSVTKPNFEEFRHNLQRSHPSPPCALNCEGHFHHNFRHNFRHNSGMSVTKNLWRTKSCHKCPSQYIVTETCPSQFSVTNYDKSVTITFVTNEIVTDSFPSQFPSQIALFRHNFINFPSQFPSQIATFSVVVVLFLIISWSQKLNRYCKPQSLFVILPWNSICFSLAQHLR